MIEFILRWDAIVNAIGAAAMVALGIWVLTLTPRTRSMTMLATFVIAAGLIYVPVNLVEWDTWALFAVWLPYLAVVATTGGIALLGLIHELVHGAGVRGRHLWWLGLGITGVTLFAPLVVAAAGAFPGWVEFMEAEGIRYETWRLLIGLSSEAGLDLFFTAFFALSVVLALLYRSPPEGQEDRTRTQTVIMSAALVLWPAFIAGANAADIPNETWPGDRLQLILSVVGFMTLAGLWLINAHSVPERSTEGRNMALLVLILMLLGMLQVVFIEPLYPGKGVGPVWGILRLVSMVGLAYGILQHQVLGIDAKFRWGVSRTTVAAVFIAVFFIVSEAAQEFFGGFVGSQYLGILAAGALVFALAPLQRMADLLAAKTVPAAQATASPDLEAQYRTAVRMALADGAITREEERQLAELMEESGLAPTRAFEIREQLESADDEASG